MVTIKEVGKRAGESPVATARVLGGYDYTWMNVHPKLPSIPDKQRAK